MQSAQKNISCYTICETIGNGAFSHVVLAIDKQDGQKYAIKIVDKKRLIFNDAIDSAFREKQILGITSSENIPGVVKLFHTFQDELNFVLEICSKGNLRDFVTRNGILTKKEFFRLTREIILAVSALHNLNIVHCDLKLDNILLDDTMAIKLCDFNSAFIFEAQKTHFAKQLTIQYSPPECLKDCSNVGFQTDLWSIGCILYELACGKSPFAAKTNYFSLQKIENLQIDWIYPLMEPSHKNQPTNDENLYENGQDRYFELLSDLIQQLLVDDPNKRPNAKQLLQHPFYNTEWFL